MQSMRIGRSFWRALGDQKEGLEVHVAICWVGSLYTPADPIILTGSLCQGVQAPVSRHLFHDRDLGTGHVDPDYLDQARAIAGHA